MSRGGHTTKLVVTAPTHAVYVTHHVQYATSQLSQKERKNQYMNASSSLSPAPRPLLTKSGTPARTLWRLTPGMPHINHGSYGAVPAAILDHQQRLRERMEQAPCQWFQELPPLLADARERTADLLGVDRAALAFVPNASAGATVVCDSLRLKPGDEILVSDMGYGAVVMGAERHALRSGATMRVVHIPIDADDDAIVAAFAAGMTEHTRLVIVDEITSATAMLFPVARIVATAHERGIRVLVDGAHAPGLIPGNPMELGAEYWTGNLHKFVCNPRATAVLAAAPSVADELYPLIDSWGRDLPYPQRFDEQGTGDYTAWLCAPVTLAYLEREFGWDRIRTYANSLADWAQQLIANAFAANDACGDGSTVRTADDYVVRLANPAPAMRLVRLPEGLVRNDQDAAVVRRQVIQQFGFEATFTSFDGVGYMRLSAYIYNTADDYRRFADEIVPVLVAWSRDRSLLERGADDRH
ncbi:aminotransferase class V [Bifidobacterium hapali]|uniref:Aminotransferase class V n=2 Tax=Bifidobacterium hapali TaxID=1630172 RepID=A0A261G5Y2_9BIFI|nr:aminotransferase class V [Bifidobacterium hapali]